MQRITQLISVLLHPLFMPLYATWILLNSGSYLSFAVSKPMQTVIYMIVLITTYILPAISSWFLYQKGVIKSLEMETRAERSLPLFSAIVSYIAGLYLLIKLPLPKIFAVMLSGGLIVLVAAFLINLRWKISLHMLGIGGLMGLLLGFSDIFHSNVLLPVIITALVSGLLASVRLWRNAHSPAQIYVGFLTGFVVQYGYFWGLERL
jgi:hypothetical protein